MMKYKDIESSKIRGYNKTDNSNQSKSGRTVLVLEKNIL